MYQMTAAAFMPLPTIETKFAMNRSRNARILKIFSKRVIVTAKGVDLFRTRRGLALPG